MSENEKSVLLESYQMLYGAYLKSMKDLRWKKEPVKLRKHCVVCEARRDELKGMLDLLLQCGVLEVLDYTGKLMELLDDFSTVKLFRASLDENGVLLHSAGKGVSGYA